MQKYHLIINYTIYINKISCELFNLFFIWYFLIQISEKVNIL